MAAIQCPNISQALSKYFDSEIETEEQARERRLRMLFHLSYCPYVVVSKGDGRLANHIIRLKTNEEYEAELANFMKS